MVEGDRSGPSDDTVCCALVTVATGDIKEYGACIVDHDGEYGVRRVGLGNGGS